MKKNMIVIALLTISSLTVFAQVNKDQLALEVSKVDTENYEKLKQYVWKLHADVSGEDGNKTTLISEFKFEENGELKITVVDGKTNIEKKPGVRGKIQQNVMQDKLEYVSKAMKYSLAYTYMTKGQLLDFFDKAEISEKNGEITAIGKNVYQKGDELIIKMDAGTKFYLSKSFTTKMGEDPVKGNVQYEVFKSSGINHISTTKLELPVERITIDGMNKDYTVKVD